MSTTVPLSITQEATDYIAEKDLQQPYQQILDNLPRRFPDLQAIEVSVMDPYDLGGEPRVVFDVTRDDPGSLDDPTKQAWIDWFIEAFPPEVMQYFVVLSIYEPKHARKSIS
jgi:hypothetical protein